jgi:hypothetical protein
MSHGIKPARILSAFALEGWGASFGIRHVVVLFMFDPMVD